jgi:hypothetical protein
MIGHTELLKEIDKLPHQYFGEVIDFVGYLQMKAKNRQEADIAAYMAMAADTEREQEAREWCNAYFGPSA